MRACSLCKTSVGQRQNAMEWHYQYFHSAMYFVLRCDQCSQTFTRKFEFADHMRRDHQVILEQDMLEWHGYTTEPGAHVWEHGPLELQRNKTGNGSLSCKISGCNAFFGYQQELHIHHVAYHRLWYSCSECPTRFNNSKIAIDHVVKDHAVSQPQLFTSRLSKQIDEANFRLSIFNTLAGIQHNSCIYQHTGPFFMSKFKHYFLNEYLGRRLSVPLEDIYVFTINSQCRNTGKIWATMLDFNNSLV